MPQITYHPPFVPPPPPLHPFLLYTRPWNEETLEEAYSVLLDELTLPPSTPGGKVEFRMSLTLSLLFKFYLQIQQALGEMVGPSWV